MSVQLGRMIPRAAVVAGAGAAGVAAVLGLQAALTATRANRNVVRPEYAVDFLAGARFEGPPVQIAMLGDSTVAGVGARRESDSLAAQVAVRASEQLRRPVQVTGFGVSGARVGQVLDEQVPRLRERPEKFDAIVVVVGGNDVTHFTTPGRFEQRYAGLLDAVAAVRPGTPLVVAGTGRFLDTFSVPRPLRNVWDSYSQVLEDRQQAVASARPGVRYVDIAEESSLRYRGRRDSVSADGFHPSVVGYGMWADAIAPRVADAVGDVPTT